MKLVLAVWQDAAEADEGPWVPRLGMKDPDPVIFHQVGWLYAITATEIVLTYCVGEHQMAPRTQIPVGMIRSLVELDPVGKPLAIPKRKRKAP